MNKIYTVIELSEMARDRGRPVTPGYIRRLCRAGRVTGAFKVAGSWVVPGVDAERWLQEWSGS